jgi:hypothetical protein
MSLLVRTSTDVGALLVRGTDDPLALSVTESTSALALRVRESTSPLAMRVRGLFSPASLPGLAAWYDASDSSTALTTVSPDVPATDGQTVRRWLDKSGNNRHVENSNLTTQPQFVNATTGLQFNGTSTELVSGAFTVAQPLTMFFVARPTLPRRMMSFGANGEFIFEPTGFTFWRLNTVTNGQPWTANTRELHYAVLNNTAGTVYKNRLTPITSYNSGGNSIPSLAFGRNNAANVWFDGQLCEFILCSGAVSEANLTKTREFLMTKWGIA